MKAKKSSRLIVFVIVASGFTPTSVAAFDDPEILDASMYQDRAFHLRVSRDRAAMPCIEIQDWPKKPYVNAAVVDQIDQVKMEIPNWHGIHHIVPGSSGSSF